MNHYITPDNQKWGFDDTQTVLVPAEAVLIPSSYTVDQIPYLTLVNGVITYNQAQHDADVTAQQAEVAAKASALAKLAALGLTPFEIVALIGEK